MTPPRGSRNGSHGQRPSAKRQLEGPLTPGNRTGGRYGRTAPPYPYGPAAPSYPYGRPAPRQPPGQSRPAARIPSRAGDMRRYLAVALDCYLCLLTAGLLIRPHVETGEAGRAAVLILLPAFVLSFANQVLLTALAGASAGKLIMGIRVIGLPDAGRPRPSRLVRRWLYGLCRLPLQPWYRLRPRYAHRSGKSGVVPRERGDGDPYEDVAELRHIRRRDLLAYRAAVAGRTV